MFTFSKEDIEKYEKKCYQDNLKKLGLNLNHILGNFSEEHLDIIAENTDEHYKVHWIDISKNEKLDDQFIYDNHEFLHWPYLVQYQKLSRTIIEYFIVNNLHNNKKLWDLLVTNQKLEETVLYDMIKYKHGWCKEEEYIRFNNLILKYQYPNEKTLKFY